MLSATGQKISYSQDVSQSNDETIISIKEFWTNYIRDISKSDDSNKAMVYAKYWNEFEIEDGFTDIVNHALPVFLIGELKIINIEKTEDGFFQIKNQVQLNEEIIALFNVYVKREHNDYKLYNQFYMSKFLLKHYKAGDIDFYYPENYPFNKKKADELFNSYLKYLALYGNLGSKQITYIIGNTFNEASSFIGFDSGVLSSDSPYAGYTIKNQNIILSCREDHLHEIIHVIFFSLFPNAPFIFHEGIATYYGGTGGKDYTSLINNLKMFLENNPDTDLSDFDSFDKVLEDGTNYFYTIGASLIDYALKIGGTKKVLSLFRYSATNTTDKEDPLSAIKEELGIEEDQLNSFLRNYINNVD